MRPTTRRGRRPGKILVLFVLVLTSLFGMLGLVIDGGLVMAAHRQTQNVADSAALAAAVELMRGSTTATAKTAATTFATTYNGFTKATVTVNIPPTTGPNAGSSRHAEVIVRQPYSTVFMGAGGGATSGMVRARAVAGVEPVTTGEGVNLLDPEARPGIGMSGGARLVVDGAIVANSRAAGLDQYGAAVNWGLSAYALSTGGNSLIAGRQIHVRGGVDVWVNFWDYETYASRLPNPQRQTTDPCPLFCRIPLGADPLRTLPVPRQSNVTGITSWTRQAAVTVPTGQSRTFTPGVYENIQIDAGASATFNPGVYIFSPTTTGQGLRVNAGGNVTGNGVMFYMTGSNYLESSPGFRDATDDAQASLDGPLPPTNAGSVPPTTDSGTVYFSTFNVNTSSGTVRFTGLSDPTSPFDGMLVFQRRRNTSGGTITANGSPNVTIGGTIYAKWARYTLAMSGSGTTRYDAQFLAGSLTVSGQGTVTINSAGKNFGRANQVFLVE